MLRVPPSFPAATNIEALEAQQRQQQTPARCVFVPVRVRAVFERHSRPKVVGDCLRYASLSADFHWTFARDVVFDCNRC